MNPTLKNNQDSTDSHSQRPTTASCDGGEGVLGHPRVYLDLTKTGQAACPYCSRIFSTICDSSAP